MPVRCFFHRSRCVHCCRHRVGAVAAWTQARELGAQGMSLLSGDCQCVCDCLEGSPAADADRIPSQPGFASPFPGFVPGLPSALAPAAALTCHCCVCAGAWGVGVGGPGVIPRSVAAAWRYFRLASVGSCLAHRSHRCFLRHRSTARASRGGAPLSPGDREQTWPPLAGLSQLCSCTRLMCSAHQAAVVCALAVLFLRTAGAEDPLCQAGASALSAEPCAEASMGSPRFRDLLSPLGSPQKCALVACRQTLLSKTSL